MSSRVTRKQLAISQALANSQDVESLIAPSKDLDEIDVKIRKMQLSQISPSNPCTVCRCTARHSRHCPLKNQKRYIKKAERQRMEERLCKASSVSSGDTADDRSFSTISSVGIGIHDVPSRLDRKRNLRKMAEQHLNKVASPFAKRPGLSLEQVAKTLSQTTRFNVAAPSSPASSVSSVASSSDGGSDPRVDFACLSMDSLRKYQHAFCLNLDDEPYLPVDAMVERTHAHFAQMQVDERATIANFLQRCSRF